MATFTKNFNKAIPAGQRHQTVSNTELSSGDIISVPGILGGSNAKEVRVTTDASSDLQVRYNVLTKRYPGRTSSDGFGTPADLPYKMLAQEVELIDGSQALITVAASQINEILSSGPVSSLEVTWSTGSWTLEFID